MHTGTERNMSYQESTLNTLQDKKVLIVIDMQNDFITGPYGTEEAKNIVENVKNKIEQYSKLDNSVIIFTKDTHTEDQFINQNKFTDGRLLQTKHCIKDTNGWEFEETLLPVINDLVSHNNCKIIEKRSSGTFQWKEFLNNFNAISIEICGLRTDVNIIFNALIIRTYNPDVNMMIDQSCCAGSTPESHNMALQIMSGCHIKIN